MCWHLKGIRWLHCRNRHFLVQILKAYALARFIHSWVHGPLLTFFYNAMQMWHWWISHDLYCVPQRCLNWSVDPLPARYALQRLCTSFKYVQLSSLSWLSSTRPLALRSSSPCYSVPFTPVLCTCPILVHSSAFAPRGRRASRHRGLRGESRSLSGGLGISGLKN
jgi:hypothetical protein